MERRQALVAILVALVVSGVSRPPDTSASLDPFDLFLDSDYSDSQEVAASATPPRITTTKPSAKVIVKGKGPKVNATVKTSKSEQKNKIVKTTTINIESYTNLFVTDMPTTGSLTKKPQTVVIDEDSSETMWVKIKDGKPVPSHRKAITTQRPTSTRRATTTRWTTTTRRRSTCPPTSTRRVTPSTRSRTDPPPPRTRSPTQKSPKPTTRPSKKPTPHRTPSPVIDTDLPDIQQKVNNKQWISSMFLGNKKAKRKTTSNKPQTSWFTGMLTNIFKWVKRSSRVVSSWISSSSWFQEEEKVPDITTLPPTTTTSTDWFENILDLEDDGAYVINDNKKKPKKSIKKTYKGYQLLRTYPDIQWKVHELMDLQEETQGSGLMWWTQPSINGSTDLLVPPDLLADVKDHFKTMQIDFDVVIWDLQKAILYENPKMSKKQRIELEQIRGHPMTWRRYHRYADILRYMEYLQHSYTDIVELVPLGRSSEGLPLVAVKVSLPTNDTYSKVKSNHKKKWKLKSRMKPAVWIDGGTHAREWITPAVATWILHTLVEGEKGLGSEEDVLRQADFYIMPVVNPDGYEHSHTHDRLWRKTRSRHSDDDYYYNSWFPWNWGNTDCVGVDADRNWDHHWREKDSSKDPCSETYAGPHPFSEPETRAVSNFLVEHRDRIKVYLSLHAYSQSWLMPSSHAHAQFSDDGILMEMGKLATAALSDLYGTKFKVGTIAELGQPASGMAHDWAKARAGVKFSYHVDLRDSFGPYGFLLPGSQIVSTARETWQAVKTIVDNLSGE